MIDLITVVFREEINYLQTQAESVSVYVPEVNNIYVIVNDEDHVVDLIDTAWWRQHQHRVHIIPYSKWGYKTWVLGWENQQLLKLLAASEVVSNWSMVLDAKTWFVQTLDYTRLFDGQGRPTVGVQRTVPVFQSSREFAEKHYNISLPTVLGPAGVPFMFHTQSVRDMLSEFDNFIDFFQTHVRHPHFITEFYLYSAYILSQHHTYQTLYNNTQYYGCCNIADFDVPEFEKHFTRMCTDPRLLTASIHRRAYPLLTKQQVTKWQQFLIQRGLNTTAILGDEQWHSILTLQLNN